MSSLADLRCFNHSGREAVARCTLCGRTFCRECITEHDARLVCATCLAAFARKASTRWSLSKGILGGVWCAMSFLFTWGLFYYTGKLLLKLPSSFHDSIFQGF